MRQFYIILSFILSLPLFASAQLHYPIRTTTIVTPPVPYTLDGFVSQPGRLMLHIMVDDITLNQYPVKLRLHIEGNGIRITTNPNIPQQPVYLNGGVVTQLTGPDLELFLNPSNLLFQGYSLNEYRRNGRLPEGVYRIRFEVLDYYRNFQVSSAIPAVAMLSLTGAPVLTFPANRSEVDIDMTPVLRFSWMAVFSAIPDALISYRFRIWQIRPDSRDPYEITRVTSPLYETTTHETALLYDGSMPPLTRGSRYVWQVTAIDEGGKVLFKNNGDSDIFTLRYGKQCSVPSAVITKVTHNSVAVSWNSDPSVREYAVRYKKEDATGWQEVSTRQAGITIEGLDHSALYELTVTGNCGTETSENERVLRFKTDRFVDYSCGASAPGINLENREPLPALHRFDEFKAADFYVEVTEVSGSNGVFSGRGIASVPYLNFLQFEVVFNGITINRDRRMIDGKVVFVYDEATGMIIGGDMGRGDDPAESGPEAYNHQEALEYIAGQVITLDEDVQTVTIDNKGQVTVVTESGQKKSYLVGENQTLAIITPQSTTIVDQASGQTFHLPNTSPGSSSDVRSRAQSKLYGCEVSFRPSANSRFGFDVVGNGSVKPNSYFKRDRGGNAVPWKSLETGNSDLVTMLSTGDCPPDSLRLIRESGILTPTKPGSNNTLELLLTGGFEGQEELLTVARATLLHINDTTGSEILTEAGALGVVSYRRSTQNVVLVPVNSAGFPTQGTDRSVIIRRLNEIYGAAVVSWNVHIDNAIEVGRIKEEDFKVEGTALLSKYTTDMNRVIRAYKRDRVTDDNTMYLFFMEIPNMGSNRKGFMPLAGNYGFIFNFEARDLELIAHELAHGAFNLRHTFSENATHYFPQNQTANLMDYAGGTELWKYQWDLIHNPESILFAWGQDESEGAMTAFFGGITWIGNRLWGLAADEYESKIDDTQELFNHIYDKYDDYFTASKEANTNLSKDAYNEWSVRSYSHEATMAKTVFEKIGKAADCEFSLADKGIYFENYTIEGQDYKIAIYSQKEDVALTYDNVKLTSVKALRNNKAIKAGFTKKYKLISFYNGEGDISMVIQIIGGENNEAETAQWLNYLGLLLPSDEQEKEDTDVSITQMLTAITLYQFYQLTAIWNGLAVEEPATTTDDSQLYIVCKGDANIRKKESPFALVSPAEFLEKGKEVVLISHLTTGSSARALVRYKDGEEEYCTSTSNLKQIKTVDDESEYKVGLDLKSIVLPYSEKENKEITTSNIYTIEEVCGEYSHIYEKDGKKKIDKGWTLTSNLIKYNNFENLTVAEKKELIAKESQKATEAATEMTTGTACNYCTRNALYLIRSEPALFPKTAPYNTYKDPNKNYEWVKVLGYITEPARAQNVKEDFDILSTIPKLNERFEEIKKGTEESWSEYFLRLQNEADKGEIIIGAMMNSSGTQGHVMMMTPGGLVEITRDEQAWGYTFFDNDIKKVPRVLECGDTDRENEAPLCRNVDRKGAQQRLKWYKYKK